MSIFILEKELYFPPVHLAEPNGLLAIGGDLSPERILLAYRSGIFPMYEEGFLKWFSPDPRFVLFPEEFRFRKRIKPLLNRNEFEFTINKEFHQVIYSCKQIIRPSLKSSTWITDEIVNAYCKLHELGYAHSAEVWKDDALVGGLYGIKLGKIFFVESMFSKVSNASRFAFIKYFEQLKEEGIELIDSQYYSKYVESFGARLIPRNEFIDLLQNLVPR